MAISIISSPRSSYNPAYNPIVYVINSNNNNKPAFRYIVEIFKRDTTPVKIAELKIAPRNGDGYGYVDISGIIKNYVDKSLQFNSDYNATNNTSFDYKISFGEEYQFQAPYTGVYNLNGFMAFSSTTAHGLSALSIGYSIVARNTISPYPDSRQNINGVWTIKSIISTTDIETTTPWGVATGNPLSNNCPGSYVFADRRTERFTALTSVIGVALNAALSVDQYKDYIDAATSPWASNSAAGEIMTNLPLTGFTATLDQHLYFHQLCLPTQNNIEWVYFTNSNGSVFRRSLPGLTENVKGVAVGPGNYGAVSLVSGSGNLIESNTEWYKVQFRNTSGTFVTQEHQITLDRRCAINSIQILFMDRKSSWGSYAFQLRQKERIETDKQTYRKEVPKTLTPSWVTMDRADQGTMVYHSRFKKVYELNTNWMNDAMSLYFEELLTSPYCYINLGDGKWYSVIVENGTFETQRYKNERLIRKTINAYMSIESPVQDAGVITPLIGQGYNLSDGFQQGSPGDLVIPVDGFID